ncbi:unnamed protein product [Medioppia subpectinata]|uniref:Uncharacterized protein n=1 Tax=Medioppia subpectinata TaxID=1979941 RepID=A0A7R9PZC7_9ACAR|nr:unnamed protein product [Medioppia subpectinata]CAG2106800.1 unnamed protein product [Medioppia subpectinata]
MSDSFEMNSEEFESDEKEENKRKNRNLREKNRRDLFNLLINELCSIINYNPMPANPMDNNATAAGGSHADNGSAGNKHKTDKSSILRASITFLETYSEALNVKSDDNQKKRTESCEQNVSTDGQTPAAQTVSIFSWKPSFMANDEFIHLMLELHKTVTTDDGSDETHRLSIYDLIHEEEKMFVENFLTSKPSQYSFGQTFASILVHFKDYDFNRELKENYHVVRLIGSFTDINGLNAVSTTTQAVAEGNSRSCFVGIGRLQTPKFLREIQFKTTDGQNREFISRNSLEWKFLYLDRRAPPIIGYLPFEILGTSGYDYYHWDDLDAVVADHEQLMRTGEVTSGVYRFLTKSHEWIWLRTSYYIAYHHWDSKPEYIVCTHTVVNEQQVSAEKSNKVNDRLNGKSQENIAVVKNNDNNDDNCHLGQQLFQSTTTPMNWTRYCYTDGQKTDYPDISPSLITSMDENKTSGEESAQTTAKNMNQSQTKSSIVLEFLRQKHELLEHQIRQQQEELRRVTEQLDLIQTVADQ